jgi:hypothetical protein
LYKARKVSAPMLTTDCRHHSHFAWIIAHILVLC